MRRKKLFEKSEFIYLVLSVFAIAILVLFIIIPQLNFLISNLNPVLQFLFLNLGLYAVFMFVFKAIALKKRMLWEGVLGALLGFMALDLIFPEFHVGINGLVSGGIFGQSAVDYFFGYVYSKLGVGGLGLVILTYPITFIILFVLGALLVKDFVRKS